MKLNFKKLVAIALLIGLNVGNLSIFLLPKQANAQQPDTVEIESIQATSVQSGSGTQSQLALPAGGTPKIPVGEAVVGGSKCLISWKKGLKKTANATKTIVNETAEVESVPVGGAWLRTIDEKLGKIDVTTTGTEADTTSLNRKERCFDGLVTLISRILIQQITKATVDWINNGFKGPDGEASPLYVTDPIKFFKNVGDAQINLFGLDIEQLTKDGNPYAGAFFKGFTDAVQKRFVDNARYTFNEVMTGPTGISLGAQVSLTVDDFYRDFGVGGWSAWLALTQVPYNNPIGAQIEFSQELGRRLRGTYLSAAEQLREEISAAGGFLGDERCIDDHGEIVPNATRRSHNKYLMSGGTNGVPCAGHFEYVTPGRLVASTIEWSESSPLRQLELSKEITDAVAAIMDALFAYYTSRFFKGLKRDDPEPYQLAFDQTTTPPYIPGQYLTGDWFVNHSNFDISEGIPEAIIDEQRTFVDKLRLQNAQIPELIKWIYQLDYCIPGPHPGWQEDSQEQLNKLFETIPNIENEIGKKVADVNFGQYALTGASMGAIVGSIVPGLGTAIGAGIGAAVGAITAVIISNVQDMKEDDVEDIGSALLEAFIDVDVANNQSNPSLALKGIGSKQGIVDVVQIIFDEYTSKLTPRYAFPQPHMPTVTPEAKTEFKNIPGYQNVIKNNEERISIMQSIVKNLELLKDDITQFLATTPAGSATYVQGLNDFGAQFARLTNQMVSGDDITTADDFTKQLQDRVLYIKNVLVGTPTTVGCERELTELKTTNPTVYGKYLGRQPYPSIFARPSGAPDYSTLHTSPPSPIPQSLVPYMTSPPQGFQGLIPGLLNFLNKSGSDGFLYNYNYQRHWTPPHVDNINCPQSSRIDTISLPADSAAELKLDLIFDSRNGCDAITRRFEKMIGVY